jgi:hypothetical protein
MGPKKTNDKQCVSASDADATVKQVIALIDDLIVVVAEENKILARGIPASLSTSVARKNELADLFELWVRQITSQQLFVRVSDHALRLHVLDRVRVLRVEMAENVERLTGAIEATRRRIDAVMRAIRTEVAGPVPYGPNGRMRAAGTAQPCYDDIRA